MNLLKRSQLAKALDISNASITMAIKNGTLLLDAKTKKVDIDNVLNKIWIDKQVIKGNILDLNRIYNKPKTIQPIKKTTKKELESPKKENKENKEITISDLREIELKQKKATLQRTLKAIKLDDLRIQKQEGKLIPFDAVKTVFLFAVETFRTTYLQEVKSLANVFINRLGGEHKDFIEIQKDIGLIVEEIQKETIDNLLTGLDGIVNEYKEVRGRGEKK